jgi:hypothetical protein
MWHHKFWLWLPAYHSPECASNETHFDHERGLNHYMVVTKEYKIYTGVVHQRIESAYIYMCLCVEMHDELMAVSLVIKT